tara:strand:+ start:32 stop:355 length:324 start_codon:yes stop_codon:yes gene_type:complete
MATKNVNDSNFKSEVLEATKLVLVDFWAEWCGPCKQISPMLEEISEEKRDIISVVKLNIDENPETTQKYGIKGIPTLMIFKDGNLTDTKIGSLPRSSIIEWIDSNIS